MSQPLVVTLSHETKTILNQIIPFELLSLGMSATLPNVAEVCRWLNNAIVHECDFRPVPLLETYLFQTTIHSVQDHSPLRPLPPMSLPPPSLPPGPNHNSNNNKPPAPQQPKKLTAEEEQQQCVFQLCAEVVVEHPERSVLVFCATKKHTTAFAKNVARIFHNVYPAVREIKVSEEQTNAIHTVNY